jgi:hypothetical protein
MTHSAFTIFQSPMVKDAIMSDNDNSRPIGNTPIADAASATAPRPPANDTTYPDDASKVSSNADLRVGENDQNIDAAMSPTGADVDNDHADERPVDRSQDAPPSGMDVEVDLDDNEDEQDEQYTPVE